MARSMSNTELQTRKYVQPRVSEVTGTLGLAALGGTLLATKRGGRATKAAFNALGRKRPAVLKPKNIRRHMAPMLATSAGVGALGALNSAAIGRQETRKKKPVFKKSYSLEMNSPNEIGIGKRYIEELEKRDKSRGFYDSEANREKRAGRYQAVSNVGSGALAAGAVSQARKGKKLVKLKALNQHKKVFQVETKALGHVGRAGALGAGAAGAAYAGHKIGERRKSGSSWDRY